MHVVSGQTNSANSQTVPLSVGDPVTLDDDGGIALCAAAGDAPVFGIIVGFGPYWDGTKMVRGNSLPSGNTWGTIEERRPYVWVVPASTGFWEVDADDAVTATTETAYRLMINFNIDHIYAATDTTKAVPLVDISLAAATANMQWRIVDVSPTMENQDFSGSNVKLIVAVNQSYEPGRPDVDAGTSVIQPGV
jgi:hypothetical protein